MVTVLQFYVWCGPNYYIVPCSKVKCLHIARCIAGILAGPSPVTWKRCGHCFSKTQSQNRKQLHKALCDVDIYIRCPLGFNNGELQSQPWARIPTAYELVFSATCDFPCSQSPGLSHWGRNCGNSIAAPTCPLLLTCSRLGPTPACCIACWRQSLLSLSIVVATNLVVSTLKKYWGYLLLRSCSPPIAVHHVGCKAIVIFSPWGILCLHFLIFFWHAEFSPCECMENHPILWGVSVDLIPLNLKT